MRVGGGILNLMWLELRNAHFDFVVDLDFWSLRCRTIRGGGLDAYSLTVAKLPHDVRQFDSCTEANVQLPVQRPTICLHAEAHLDNLA